MPHAELKCGCGPGRLCGKAESLAKRADALYEAWRDARDRRDWSNADEAWGKYLWAKELCDRHADGG